MDAFSHYQYRNNTVCPISSLYLAAPFAPLCTTRAEMFEAISGGVTYWLGCTVYASEL
jgi:hypothetical protein